MTRDHSDTVAEHDSTEPQMAEHSGGALPSRYKAGELIGRGGMGVVVSARDEQIGRSVAIKRLRGEPDPETLARFLREARVQGRLEHPAVVPVHELAYDEANQPFFVMKQLTGVTLADVLPKLADGEAEVVEKFSTQRLLRAFGEVCLAIEFAHTRGVVHRDLKPANIMLGDFGEVYVLDWGVARVTGDDEPGSTRKSFAELPGGETSAGSMLGTPGYMSPEQIQGEGDVDARSDVYSLGCILFEVLALAPLHPRGQAGLASALAGVDARPSRTTDREIPPELDAICARATALARTDRFPTARALGEAVQRYLDGNRDIALRKTLARAELETARTALKGLVEDADQRREAMRSAARAIALDPSDRDAVELVGHLMLQPPKIVPPEVERELADADADALIRSTRIGLIASMSMLVFFPVLYWMGFRDQWFYVAGPLFCAVVIFSVLIVARFDSKASAWLSIAANLALFALLSSKMTPLLFGAGPAVLLVTVVVPFRLLRLPWPIAASAAVATLVPWWLQGGQEQLVSIDGGNIILHTAAANLDPFATAVGLSVYIALTIHMSAWLTRLADDDRRASRRTLQIQAWQLRQLVPRPTSVPPA